MMTSQTLTELQDNGVCYFVLLLSIPSRHKLRAPPKNRGLHQARAQGESSNSVPTSRFYIFRNSQLHVSGQNTSEYTISCTTTIKQDSLETS